MATPTFEEDLCKMMGSHNVVMQMAVIEQELKARGMPDEWVRQFLEMRQANHLVSTVTGAYAYALGYIEGFDRALSFITTGIKTAYDAERPDIAEILTVAAIGLAAIPNHGEERKAEVFATAKRLNIQLPSDEELLEYEPEDE